MIPPPTSEKDDEKSRTRYETIRTGQSQGIGGDPYYGYVDNLYDRVVENFGRFGQPVDGRRVSLCKGYFEDTLHPQTDIAFAHIDCDWYDPVKLCLERIVPRLSAGAYVVLDDYNDYGGCRRAVDEFLDAVLGDLLGPEFAAAPKEMFGPDRFHPSAAGYRAAVQTAGAVAVPCWPEAALTTVPTTKQ